MGDSDIVRNDKVQPQNPILNLFSKFTQSFNLPQTKQIPPKPESKSPEPAAGDDVGVSKGPGVVKIPNRPIVPPLKLEAEELEADTNPVVLWQVYAIGGFFILKWVWARWNERRGKNNSTDEDPPPANE